MSLPISELSVSGKFTLTSDVLPNDSQDGAVVVGAVVEVGAPVVDDALVEVGGAVDVEEVSVDEVEAEVAVVPGTEVVIVVWPASPAGEHAATSRAMTMAVAKRLISQVSRRIPANDEGLWALVER
jgi:hypothetical protein